MRWVGLLFVLGEACTFRVDTLPLATQDGAIPVDDGARAADGRAAIDAPPGTPDATRADAARPDAPPPDAARPDAKPPDCSATTPGLLACWEFEGNGTDSHGGHDATLSGTTFAAGQTGMGLASSAPDSRAYVAPAADFQTTTRAATIEAWIKPASIPGEGTRVGVLDTDGQWSIFIYPPDADPSGKNGMVRCSIAGAGTVFGGTIAPETAYHLACTYDSATGLLALYVDGASAGTLTAAMNTGITTTMASTEIGGNSECPTAPCMDVFSGTIDNLRVWSVARTPQQIAADATE